MRWLSGGTYVKTKLLLFLCVCMFFCAAASIAAIKGLEMWRARNWTTVPYALQNNTVIIDAALSAPKQEAHFFSSNVPAPLIVDLHPWSSALGAAAGDNGIRLDELAYRKSWSYIRPTLTGHNRNPTGCCGNEMIDAIKVAIDFARKNAQVTSVHVIGGSGGGYTALCGALSGKLDGIAAYQVWIPITDLESWYQQRPPVSYERDILACTNSSAKLNVAEARRRSPIYMSVPSQLPTVHLFAGVHDGSGGSISGSVPITHTIRMYNKLSKDPIGDDVLLRLLEARKGPLSDSNMSIDGRQVHLAAESGSVSVTIFEGGHEVLANAAMDIAIKDANVAKKATTAF